MEIEVAKHIAAEQGVKNHLLDMSLLGQLTENALTRDIVIEIQTMICQILLLMVEIICFIVCSCAGEASWYHRHYYWRL